MQKSIKVYQNKRGRPATGRDPVVAVRLPAELLQKLDSVPGSNGERVTRSVAIRLVLERALNRQKAPARRNPGNPSEGDTMATAAAVKRIDKAQAHEKPGTGRGKRKKALTEIPAELLASARKPKAR